MAKRKKKNQAPAPKPKKKDFTLQNVRKAKRSLKSAGVKGLINFLEIHPEIRSHKTVKGLLEKAGV